MNGIPLINGQEYSWGDIQCLIAGVAVIGITAIEYGEDQEVKDNYGAGRYPISRSKGRITTTAKITLTMDEVVAIQKNAINGRLQDIAAFDIVVAYVPTEGAKITKDVLRNCQFMSNKRTWKEGDTRQEVEMELICSHIQWGK